MRLPIPNLSRATRLAATWVVDPYAAVAYWQRALGMPWPGPGSLAAAVRDKRVVVTGASSGIGREVALKVGQAGGDTILISRRRAELEKLAALIQEEGGKASVHPADLADSPDVERVGEEILAAHGGVDILINNAGHSIRRPIAESYGRRHDFDRTIKLNYLGPVGLTLAFLPGMRDREFGHIVNVSTLGVLFNTPRFAAYLASKAALDMFARSVAPEVISDGVHFTTVYMPLVRTPMIAPTSAYEGVPALTPRQAARLMAHALISRPREVTPLPGRVSRSLYPLAPKSADRLVGLADRVFGRIADSPPRADPTAEPEATVVAVEPRDDAPPSS